MAENLEALMEENEFLRAKFEGPKTNLQCKSGEELITASSMRTTTMYKG